MRQYIGNLGWSRTVNIKHGIKIHGLPCNNILKQMTMVLKSCHGVTMVRANW